MTKYSKGEWTNARYDICEIECDGEVYCKPKFVAYRP